MAATLSFPNFNNKNFRNGWIKLTARASEFDQSTVDGSTAKLVTRLKNTSRKVLPDYTGDSKGYLQNAISNMKKAREDMGGKVKFVCILPLPLAVSDDVAVEWASTPSNFIEGAYGKVKKAGLSEVTNSKLFDDLVPSAIAEKLSKYGGAVRGGNAALRELAATRNLELSQAISNSEAAMAFRKPSLADVSLVSLNTDASLMELHNEAAAMGGIRQVVFDPGYWQSFSGVNPRTFTLSWDIIPENHAEAVNGLVLCARLKEFSLPQSASGVELLSPPYWQLDWSADLLTSQTLYSSLVITNIKTDYAQNGEFHAANTPKMFRISITFAEAKAPNADIYKQGYNSIPVEQGAAGGG